MLARLPSWMILAVHVVADIAYTALIPAVMFAALATIIVALRLYCRIRLSARNHGMGAEDLFVVAAMLLSILLASIVGVEFATDVKQVRQNRMKLQIEKMMKLVYAQSIAYHLAINFVKISILLQYRKLFRGIYRVMIWACYILFAIVLVTAGWGVGGVIFLCNPIRKYWKVFTPGTCINAEQHFWSTAILGIILDCTIWALPIPAIGKLHVGGRHKLGLLVMFGLGAFTCIASALRLVIVDDAAQKGDVTKSGTHALIWSTVELNTAIICSSLLVMKPLFLRFIPNLVNDDQPTTAREDASDFCRALAEVGLTGPVWDPWIWMRDGLRGQRSGETMRQCLPDASDSTSSTSDQSAALAAKQKKGQVREWRGDSCVGNVSIEEIERPQRAMLARGPVGVRYNVEQI